MTRRLLVIVWLLSLGRWLLAEDLGYLLLKEGVSVRALGMGGAYTAAGNDAGALFYNPAGLAETGLGYTSGSLDSQQINNDIGFTLVKLGYLGYSEGRLTNPGGDIINYSALGFGNRSGWLNWGTNYKSLDWTLSGVKDGGWSGDLGLLMRVTPQFKIGVAARDVLTTKSRLAPASLRLGLSFNPFKSGQLILAADAELYRSRPGELHLGLEASPLPGLKLRGGLDRGTPTAGASLDLAAFTLDYALLLPPDGKNIQRYEAGFKLSFELERPFAFFKPREFAIIDISGAIKGGQSEASLLGGYRPGLDSILENIRAAAKDSAIDGIFLRLGGFSGGLGGAAVVQELRAELARARAKCKKIIAYIEGSAVGDEYYLASAADKIVAAPGSAIGGFGRSLEIYRFGGPFKKFGVDYQVMYKGKYKTSFDWLSPQMNADQKAMLEALVADIYRQMLNDIAASRQIPIEKVKAIGDGMVFPAGLAQN